MNVKKLKPNRYYKWRYNKIDILHDKRIRFIHTSNDHVYLIGMLENERFYSDHRMLYSIEFFSNCFGESVSLEEISYADMLLEML